MPSSSATATATTTLPDVWSQLSRWLRFLRYCLVGLAALFFVLLAVEAVRLYQTAAAVHPLLGVGAVLLAVAGSLLLAIPIYRFFQVPRAIQPPAIPAEAELDVSHLTAEVKFLRRYLASCSRNVEMRDRLEAIAKASGELDDFARRLSAAGTSDVATLNEELGRWTETVIPAILSEVDARAEKIIYEEAITVGVSTAVSPNGALDAFVMLWRALNLSSKLAVLYYGRPGLGGTLAIFRDVSVAALGAAYLQNITDSLGNVLARSVGGIGGMVAAPAIDGITNALVLVRIGYLTKERCRSFRQWDTKARQSALIEALAATQKVALGLTGEILRKVGTGLGMLTEAAARGVSQAADAAGKAIGSTAESALTAVTDFGEKVAGLFGRKEPDEKEG